MAILCRYGHQRLPDLLDMSVPDLVALAKEIASLVAAENRTIRSNND